jgi:outer membrane receptor protein involved in Fe transport
MVYAEAAKGFRFGGANQPVPIGSTGIAEECASELAAYGYKSAPLTFGPDHLWNYTVGEKASLLGGRMTLDADAYYIDWQDVQTRLGLNCSYFFTENKGSVTSQGLELESVARLTSNFTAKVSVGYNDSRANGDIPTVGAFNGDQSPYAPNWTSAVFLFYDHHLSDGMLHGQLSYQFRSEENTTYDPYSTTIVNGVLTRTTPSTSFAIIPPTHNVSASLAYDFQTYEIGLYGNNLIDGVKVTDIARAGYFALYQAGDAYTVARPRTVGIRLKAKF